MMGLLYWAEGNFQFKDSFEATDRYKRNDASGSGARQGYDMRRLRVHGGEGATGRSRGDTGIGKSGY